MGEDELMLEKCIDICRVAESHKNGCSASLKQIAPTKPIQQL